MNEYRTHNCGELRLENVGNTVKIAGWIQKIRNLGGMTFIDLRDQFGITQVIISENEELQSMAKDLVTECVISVEGNVLERTNKNTSMGMALGMCFGVSIGTAIGNTFDNMSIGTSLGLCIGMAIGIVLGSQKDKEVNKQLEENLIEITKQKQEADKKMLSLEILIGVFSCIILYSMQLIFTIKWIFKNFFDCSIDFFLF